MDFGDLSDNKPLQQVILNLHGSIEKIAKLVDLCTNPEFYEKLATKERIDFDLFVAYTINTLYWVYLKTKGQDPAKTEIKDQLNRVKQYMVKAKEAQERQTRRPRVDKGAAARFVKHGIQYRDGEEPQEPPNKKIKL